MQVVTQDRKHKIQGLEIAEVYKLVDTEQNTFKVKARLRDSSYLLLGEYASRADMEHYFRIAQYEIALDTAETVVYM